MLDLFGKALLDYQTHNNPQDLITETNLSEPDEMPVEYLFRNHNQMPPLEQKALAMVYGKVLDIGCGAGSHSLYLQNKGVDVTALDQSLGAIQTCKLRGIHKTVHQGLYQHSQQYNTLLLLMNGTGIAGTMTNINLFLQHLKSMLLPNGQILIDSSDIIYMFDDDDDGGKWIPAEGYYGELTFTLHYKGDTETIPWLYLDYNTLQNAAYANGLACTLVQEGEHYDYLAKLTHIP